MADEQQFLFQTVESARDIGALRIFRHPLVELHFFGFSTAEKENFQVVSLAEQLNDALHVLQRINFSYVGSKRCNSNPFFSRFLSLEFGWEHREIGVVMLVNISKATFDGKTEFSEHFGIVFEGSGLLFK